MIHSATTYDKNHTGTYSGFNTGRRIPVRTGILYEIKTRFPVSCDQLFASDNKIHPETMAKLQSIFESQRHI